MPVQANEIFAQFPNESYWKLIMDPEYWVHDDPLYFDRDKSTGYLSTVGLGLYAMLRTLNEPITVEQIIGLHGLSYHQVPEREKRIGLVAEAGSGLNAKNFNIAAQNFDGIIELFEKIKAGMPYLITTDPNHIHQGKITFDLTESSEALAEQFIQETLMPLLRKDIKSVYIFRQAYPKEVYAHIAYLIERYEKEISESLDDLGVIKAIVRLVQNLHQYHPFRDGNGRIFIFLILNKLLMQNQFSPSTFPHPFHFTGASEAELVEEVIQGQIMFGQLCDNHNSKSLEFIDFLEQELGISENHQFFIDIFLANDADSIKLIEEANVYLSDHEFRFTVWMYVLTNKYNKEFIEKFIRMYPLEMTDEQEKDFIFLAIQHGNYELIDFYIDYIQETKKDLSGLKSPKMLNRLLNLKSLSLPDVEKIMHKLQVNGKNVINLLSANIEVDTSGLKISYSVLRHMLEQNNINSIKFLFDLLDPTEIKIMLSLNMQGINVLQLFSIFNDELYENYRTHLNLDEQLKLMQATITTKLMPEADYATNESYIKKLQTLTLQAMNVKSSQQKNANQGGNKKLGLWQTKNDEMFSAHTQAKTNKPK